MAQKFHRPYLTASCVRRGYQPLRVPRVLPSASAPEALVWRIVVLITATVPLAVYGRPHSSRDCAMDLFVHAAIAHEAVIEHFARASGTIVIPISSHDVLLADKAIEEVRGPPDRARVKRIAGRNEWGVRVARLPLAPAARGKPRGRPASGAAFSLRVRTRAMRPQSRARRGRGGHEACRSCGATRGRARRERRRSQVPSPVLEAAFSWTSTARARSSRSAPQAAACASAGRRLPTVPCPRITRRVPETPS